MIGRNYIYEQNKNGTTSDAELMANTSLLPISESAYFIQYPWKKQNTLQRLLEKHMPGEISFRA